MSRFHLAGALPLALLLCLTACDENGPSPQGLAPGDGGGNTVVPDAPEGTGSIDPDSPTALDPDAQIATPLPDAPPEQAIPDAPVVAPVGAVSFGPNEGLPAPIYDVTTDEAGNVWAISADTLFLMTPGAQTFVGFGNADGLHVEPFTAPDGTPLTTRLTAVAGATANRIYLGYQGYESDDPFNDTPEEKALGNGDRIDYDPSTGHIAVNRYQFKCVVEVSRCWEDRSVRRIVVGHTGAAAGHAFFGFNHGTTHVFNDILGDHVHPEINWVDQTSGAIVTKYGECAALSLNDDGTLWIGNRYGVGLMNWNPDPIAWTTAKFKTAFTTYTDNHSLDVDWGYVEDNRGASVSPDGTLWLASGSLGLTSWNPASPLTTMRHWDPGTTGIPTTLADVAADTDGTVWLVVQGGPLLHLDPATGAVTASTIHDARRLYIDHGTPRSLYIARGGGVTVIH